MKLAILGKDVLATVGYQEIAKQAIAVVGPDGGDLHAQRIHLAHALGAQLRLHRLEEIPEGVPGLRGIR